MRNNGPAARSPQSSRQVVSAPETTNLADLLERVLDKGIVIAGDITLSLVGVELLTLKIRLLIASIDKAQEIGINWWQSDPFLSSRAREKELAARTRKQELEGERELLTERLDRLERLLLAPPREADQEHPAAGQRSNAAPARVLDKEGRRIAKLQQSHEEERLQTRERAQQPDAAQADQSAGGGQLLNQALQEHIAQAVGPVLGELQQRIAQASQPVERSTGAPSR